MYWIQSPLVWLCRFRKRKGYGIHSPWAFGFVTGVLYEHESYYAYEEIDRRLHWWQWLRYRSTLHLIFRLSNFWSDKPMRLIGADEQMIDVSRMASSSHPKDGEEEMVAVMDIHKKPNREKWRSIKENPDYTVTFDLSDIGVAFKMPKMVKQHYKINW